MSDDRHQFKVLDLSTRFICFPTMVKLIQTETNISSLKINQFSLKDKHDPITSNFSHGRIADEESYDTRLMNDKYDFINFLDKFSSALPQFTHQLKELTIVDIRKEEVEDNVWDAGFFVKCDEPMNETIRRNMYNKMSENTTQRNQDLLSGFYRENNSETSSLPYVIVMIINQYYFKWWSLTSLSVDHYIGSPLVDWVSINCPQMQLLQLTKYWPSDSPNKCFSKLFENCKCLIYLHVEQNYMHENKGYSVSLEDCKKINFKNFKGIKLVRTGQFLSTNCYGWMPNAPRTVFLKLLQQYIVKQLNGDQTIEEYLQNKANKFHFCEFQDVRTY
eukprot:154379_1